MSIGNIGNYILPSCICNGDIENPSSTQTSRQTLNLSERICPYWRMSAGLVCLATSILGIWCSLFFWSANWLSIPFGISAVFSIQTVYSAYQFKHLKTFENNNLQLQETNTQLQTNVVSLQENNTQLQNQISTLQTENQTYQQENRTLIQTSANLQNLLEAAQENNANHERLIERLQEQIGILTNLQISMEQKTNAHVEQLENLQEALRGIQDSAAENHQLFGEKLETFVENLISLQSIREQYSQVSSETVQAMANQNQALLETGNTLKIIFERIKEWKDNEHVERQLNQLQTLNRHIQEATGKLENITGQITQMQSQLQELNAIKQGFSSALNTLLDNIQKLGEETGQLSEVKTEILRAAAIFQQYGIQSSSN